MELKQVLYDFCSTFIGERLLSVQNVFDELQEAMFSETKSSAGDKHETGRAMLQIEREKTGNQLAVIQKTKGVLNQIDISKTSELVCLGSVVYTTKLNYFIAISAGETKQKGLLFYCISPHTPMAQLLLSKRVEDVIIFRDQEFKITEIV